MKQLKTREIAFDAIMLSLITLLTFFKPLGFPTFGPVSATTVHIPVIIAIIYYKSWKKALLFGIFFGLASLISNLTIPGPLSIFFINPLISVLPRILMALITFYLALKFKPWIAAFLGSWANTILVLSSLGIIYQNQINKLNTAFWPLVKSIVLTNSILEAILASIIASSIIKIIQK